MASGGMNRILSKVTNDDWKMCYQWILEILPQERQRLQCSQLVEFANLLRDGVVLCSVLNRICPGAIPKQKVATLTKSLHFHLQNVSLARQAIIEKLDIGANNVFVDRDLASLENFYKVLLTLSLISHLQPSLATGAKAWPPDDHSLNDDDQIYGRLDEMPLITHADNFSSPAPPPRTPRGLHASPSSSSTGFALNGGDAIDGAARAAEDDDDVYQNLAFQNDGEEEAVYDKVVAPPKLEPGKTKREYAVLELVNTEETYVDSLKMIVTEVMMPSRTFMGAEPWMQLFNYIDQLLLLHKAFLDELKVQAESALQPNGRNKLNLHGIWMRRKREFLVYTKYVVNKPIAEAAFDRITKTDDRVRQQFNELCSHVRKMRTFSLREYLFVPIQRVLKYHLLLDAICKHTKDDDEKKNMQESMAVVSDIQRCINEAQRDGEMLDKIQIIQSAIADMSLPPDTRLCDYGRMHIDGEVLVRSHADNHPGVRFVFLFDFMLIICKIQPRQPQQYRLRDCCYVTNLDVSDLDPTANFRPKDKFKYPFEVRKRQGPNPQDQIENVYVMAVRSEHERKSWMEALLIAKKNLKPPGFDNGGHYFIYKMFDEPYECCVCGKLMAGGLFQGYECAVECCRMVAHGKCLPSVPPEPPRRPEPVTAVRPYNGSSPEHPRRLPTLIFQPNEIITLWVRVTSEWAYGEKGDEKGFFPLSHVKERRVALVVENPNDLSNYPWFVGEMPKEEAGQILRALRSGTFLVRQSLAISQKPGEYAISLKYDRGEIDPNNPHDGLEHIRHIRIVRFDNRFSLSQDPPYFSSVVELIGYYQKNSLRPVFNELPICLTYPFQNSRTRNILFQVRAVSDFEPASPAQLRLTVNEVVDVLDAVVPGLPRNEWFRGRNRNGNVGVFPASFVRRL